MVSIGVMVKQVVAMHDTGDLTEWENEFVASICERTKDGAVTTKLTPKQADIVDRIWRRHFA